MSATNDFATVSIGNANTVTLRDADGITLGTCGPTTDLSVTRRGRSTRAVSLRSGNRLLRARRGELRCPEHPEHHFATVIVTNGADAFFLDADGIVLGAVTISGTSR
jgi:hypothetical protein